MEVTPKLLDVIVHLKETLAVLAMEHLHKPVVVAVLPLVVVLVGQVVMDQQPLLLDLV